MIKNTVKITGGYEVNILVKGRPITEYLDRDDNTFVEGREGTEYTLQFKNSTNERVCIIPAVDGLSVMDGEEANLESDGYVVNRQSTIEIPGWRLNTKEVAKFVFSTGCGSYSSKSKKGNNGVIGFMVFKEKPFGNPAPDFYKIRSPVPFNGDPYIRYGSSSAGDPNFGKPESICTANTQNWKAPPVGLTVTDNSVISNSRDYLLGGMAFNASSLSVGSATMKGSATRGLEEVFTSVNNVGTGFGEQTQFSTTTISFQKNDPKNPDEIIVIYYDDARGLERRGINVRKRYDNSPSAFPGYVSDGCKPPKDWNTAGGPDGYPKKGSGSYHRT
jgi:hypothetical protein